MRDSEYLASLKDGFHLARRMGFTNTSQALSDMLNVECEAHVHGSGSDQYPRGMMNGVPATSDD